MSNIDSIIERINNLMAIAENEASSDNEAQMAFERAQKLINEYRIEDWKRDRTRTNKPIIERGVNVSKPPSTISKATLRPSSPKLTNAAPTFTKAGVAEELRNVPSCS